MLHLHILRVPGGIVVFYWSVLKGTDRASTELTLTQMKVRGDRSLPYYIRSGQMIRVYCLLDFRSPLGVAR